MRLMLCLLALLWTASISATVIATFRPPKISTIAAVVIATFQTHNSEIGDANRNAAGRAFGCELADEERRRYRQRLCLICGPSELLGTGLARRNAGCPNRHAHTVSEPRFSDGRAVL